MYCLFDMILSLNVTLLFFLHYGVFLSIIRFYWFRSVGKEECFFYLTWFELFVSFPENFLYFYQNECIILGDINTGEFVYAS